MKLKIYNLAVVLIVWLALIAPAYLWVKYHPQEMALDLNNITRVGMETHYNGLNSTPLVYKVYVFQNRWGGWITFAALVTIVIMVWRSRKWLSSILENT
jgi:hypothetical protein